MDEFEEMASDFLSGDWRTDGRLAFDAVWVDHFWDARIEGVVFAADMDEAIERARAQRADGLPIDSLRLGDDVVEGLSGGHSVRAARVLIEIDGTLIEDTIPALTWSMASELASDMYEPYGEVLAVQDGNDALVFVDKDRFVGRDDIPLGWLEILEG